MNIFENEDIANNYDTFYGTEFGKEVDKIEKKMISKLISPIPRARMLELGCGTGHWTDFFRKEGFPVTAIDGSKAMLAIARRKKLDADLILAKTEELPFKNESFGIISTITMLEFVDDPGRVFQEIYRVLKPDGWLILGTLNADSALARISDQDTVLRNARFFKLKELKIYLNKFGRPVFGKDVYLSDNITLLVDSKEKKECQPAFIVAIVQKIY